MSQALLYSHGAAGTLDNLARQLSAEMSACWRAGEQPTAAQFVSQYPELLHDQDALLRLVYEEIFVRNEHGAPRSLDDYCRDFPDLRKEINTLLYFHQLLSA